MGTGLYRLVGEMQGAVIALNAQLGEASVEVQVDLHRLRDVIDDWAHRLTPAPPEPPDRQEP